ncbi:MAG: hypothetical protein U1E87_01410 [Alphaproteobacteria bacterium]
MLMGTAPETLSPVNLGSHARRGNTVIGDTVIPDAMRHVSAAAQIRDLVGAGKIPGLHCTTRVLQCARDDAP